MNEKFLCFDNPKNVIYACLFMLMIIGCINIYSASFVYAANEIGSSYHFVGRYFFFAIFSVICLWAVKAVGYKRFLYAETLIALGALVVASLFFVYFFGEEINSARRWINFGILSVQPSEFAKLFIILLCSSLLGKNMVENKRRDLLCSPIAICLLAGLSIGFLVALEPDAGTGIIIFALAFLMVFISGLRWEQTLIICGVGIALVVGLIFVAPYRLERLKIWLNPWIDPTGAGYQMVQSTIAIGSGQFSGMGWGNGTSKFFFLPELHTDFAFAVFCQESGFIGALALILTFLFMGYALWSVLRRCTDSSGVLLVSGVIMMVIGQAVINMAMVCGILPVSGVPLSFISYGGSNLLVSTIAVGLAISVYDEECEKEHRIAMHKKLVGDSPEVRRAQWRIIDGGKK